MDSGDLERLLARPDDAIAIGNGLRAARYSSQEVVDALDMSISPDELIQSAVLCSLAYYSPEAVDSASQILGTLFALSGWVQRKAYVQKVDARLRSLLESYNLVVSVDDDTVKATVCILEYRGRLFLSDRTVERTPDDLTFCNNTFDNVDQPNYASLGILEDLRMSPGGRFLDVGCGCGFFAILASDTHRESLGIDLNARAMKIASLNALLNGSSARFVAADCTTFESPERFDSIVFNTPSVPTYSARLQNVATYTSLLGYELPFRFIDQAVSRLLAPNGECLLWVIFSVTTGYESIEDLLRKETRAYDAFDVQIRTQPDSPFALSREQIAAGEMPRESYLLATPEDAPTFMSFVRQAGVQFILPAHVILRPR